MLERTSSSVGRDTPRSWSESAARRTPRGPSLGGLEEGPDRFAGRAQRVLGQQGGDFVLLQTQVRRPELREPSDQPVAMERERGTGPGEEHQPQAAAGEVEQPVELLEDPDVDDPLEGV